MVILNTQGIVLKSVTYKENDLILTIYTRKLGKIAAIARGAKKSKSSLLSSSQIFAYSNFTLKKEGNMYRVTQSEIIKSFYNLSYNFEAFSYATHILKLIDNFIIDNQLNNRLFILLAQSLYLFCEEDIDMEYVSLCFKLKFLDYIGFKPIVNKCVSCYNSDFKNPVFNIYEGGILCEKCSDNFDHNLKMNITTTKLMDYILKNDILSCSKAKVSKYLINELNKILNIYMNEYLGNINEKSLNVLKSLNKKGVEQMSKITIESIDQVIERVPGATYAQVKEALLKCDGDVVDAIILLQDNSTGAEEKEDKKTFEDVFGKDSEKMKEEITELIRKSNVVRIVVEKNGKVIINVPITVGVVGVVFAPILSLIGLSASVLAKYRIKIENEDEGTTVDLGEFSEEKLTIIKDMVSSAAKDVKQAVDKKNKNTEDKNESNNDEVIIDLNKNDYREKKDEE